MVAVVSVVCGRLWNKLARPCSHLARGGHSSTHKQDLNWYKRVQTKHANNDAGHMHVYSVSSSAELALHARLAAACRHRPQGNKQTCISSSIIAVTHSTAYAAQDVVAGSRYNDAFFNLCGLAVPLVPLRVLCSPPPGSLSQHSPFIDKC